MTIDKTFSDLSAQSTDEIRHPDPKRRNLRVVETYDILPDEEVWQTGYGVLRFPEAPTASTSTVRASFVRYNTQAQSTSTEISSARLNNALLRMGRDEDEIEFVDYFLPTGETVDRLGRLQNEPTTDEMMERIDDVVRDGTVSEIEVALPVRASSEAHPCPRLEHS